MATSMGDEVAGWGGADGYTDTAADNGRDGTPSGWNPKWGPYPGSAQNTADENVASASDPLGDIFQGLADAEIRAAEIIAAAQERAAAEIKAGMEAAARATIESAEIAAASVLEQAQISDDRLREFWGEAKAQLMPIIKQGRYASDEMAAMLAIRNSEGKLVEWDSSNLADTPGYEFAFNEGNRALQNSAVGTSLSGAQAKATIAYGQGMANTRFDTHYNQLLELARGGWDASRDMANAATQTGGNFANVHMQAGNDLGNIYMQRGSDLAKAYSTGGADLANIYMSGAEQRAGLITGLATAGANIQMAELNRQSTIAAANANASASRSNGLFGFLGEIVPPLLALV